MQNKFNLDIKNYITFIQYTTKTGRNIPTTYKSFYRKNYSKNANEELNKNYSSPCIKLYTCQTTAFFIICICYCAKCYCFAKYLGYV